MSGEGNDFGAPYDEQTTIEFRSVDGEPAGDPIMISQSTTTEQLEQVLNTVLQNDDEQPYTFWVKGKEISGDIGSFLTKVGISSSETTTPIVYLPQALFRVAPVSRCSSELPGHTAPILAAQFSPDGVLVASGSGDHTLRIWDMNTETPLATCEGHSDNVLTVNWAPDGQKVCSGGKEGELRVWDRDGQQRSRLRGHTKWINSVSWEPYHVHGRSDHLVSASKDSTAKIWHAPSSRCVQTLSAHKLSVTSVAWGGEGKIYTASEDGSVMMWDAETGQNRGILGRSRTHSHWVNTIALSTDYALRLGPFDEHGLQKGTDSERKADAQLRYLRVKSGHPFETGRKKAGVPPPPIASNMSERVLTGSDDFTLSLWDPRAPLDPIKKMTGHQGVVNSVAFSPCGRFIASASFDKSIRIWDGVGGGLIATMRGHVGRVYQVRWSADSRLVVSCSEDSTAKVWDMKTKKLKNDLPGHSDEVYSVDWSPDGERVVSVGKDKNLRIWRQ